MNGRGIAQLVGPPTVAVLLWFGFALVPSALSSQAEERIAIEDEQSRLIVELAAARRLSDVRPEFEGRLADTARAVPPTVDLATFIRATDAAADQTGVTIEQMAPLVVSSDTDEEAISVLPTGTSSVSISVGATGTYSQVIAFADALRALDRLVVLDRIDLNADEEETSKIILDLELRIFTTDALVTGSDIDDAFDDGFDESLDEAGGPTDESAGSADGSQPEDDS